MIKIVVNNRKEPKPFPKLMKHGTYNYYVYFSEKSVGHIFGADKKFYHDDGFYSIEWGMRDFEDTNDEIILNYQGECIYHEKYCADSCSHFGEPIMDADGYPDNTTVLELCQRKLVFTEFTDER